MEKRKIIDGDEILKKIKIALQLFMERHFFKGRLVLREVIDVLEKHKE